MSDYHIEKNRRRVRVRTRSGETLSGDIYLQTYGRYGGGAERPIDILNSAEHFFPLCIESGETLLMAKDQVAFVTCDGDDDQAGEREAITRRAAVEILLIDGEKLRATVHLAVPDDHPRLLDFLNLGRQRFLSMDASEGQLLVNRSMIERVRTVS